MGMARKHNKVNLPLWSIMMMYLQDFSWQLEPDHVSFIQGLIRARDTVRLASLPDVLGFSYIDPDSFRTIAQLSAFVKKNETLADDATCTEAARKSFLLAEVMCRETNERMVSFFMRQESVYTDEDRLRAKQVKKMQTYIANVCGCASEFLNALPEGCRITSGATRGLPRARALPYLKVRKRAEGTPGGNHLLRCLQEHAGMAPWKLREVKGNRVALVPKSFKTHRTIAAEPEVNVFFQLGVDRFLKRRLRRVGIDLKNQARNQMLAREGSISGKLATVDLSMASDTMALELVHLLFPSDWARLLHLIRSPRYEGVFGSGEYAKFSSMGNGATFVLETTIFWAAAKAVGSKVVSVYGDDIIVDSDKYEDLRSLLTWLGFVLNHEKSYSSGPFRESCGADFFKGVNVRPFFVKKSEGLQRPELCHYINGLAGIAGERLAALLKRLVYQYRLPLVPYNENSLSGVYVDKAAAHTLKLISPWLRKRGDWIPSFKGYSEAGRVRTVVDVRAYVLWHLTKVTDPMTPYVATEVAGEPKYKLARLCWRIPNATPGHLYWWSDYLLAAGNGR